MTSNIRCFLPKSMTRALLALSVEVEKAKRALARKLGEPVPPPEPPETTDLRKFLSQWPRS